MAGRLLASLLVALCASVLALGTVVPSQAAGPENTDPIAQARKDLDRLEKKAGVAASATPVELNALSAKIAKVRKTALECVDEAEGRLEKLKREEAILSPEEPKGKQAKAEEGAEQEEQPSLESGSTGYVPAASPRICRFSTPERV